MEGVVNIQEFVNHLKNEGMIIVSLEDYELKSDFKEKRFLKRQKKLLDKEYLTFNEILGGKLLPIKTYQSINNWIEKGIFRNGDYFKGLDGKTVIITSAIKRVRELKNFE